MSSILTISKANPLRLVITQREGLNMSQPANKKYTDLGLPYFSLDPYYKPAENADVLPLQIQSSYNINTGQLKDYHTGAVVLDNLLPDSYEVNGVGVYTYYLSLLTVNSGDYFVSLSGSHSDGKTYEAESEPIRLQEKWPGSLLLKWYNFENNFDTIYENGTRFAGRVRGRFFKDADSYSSDLYDNDAKQITLLEGSVTPARLLELFRIPSFEVALLNRCLLHDYVSINDERIVSGNRLSHDYGEFSALASPRVVCELHEGGFTNAHDSNEAFLEAPSNLTLSAPNDTQINLSWDGHNNNMVETEIWVQQIGVAPYVLLETIAAGVTEYSHTNLSTGVEYRYKLRAINGSVVSLFSNVKVFTLLPWLFTGGNWNTAGNWYDEGEWGI